eukprot:4115470-Ditylum_brightwellii.AAC.1
MDLELNGGSRRSVMCFRGRLAGCLCVAERMAVGVICFGVSEGLDGRFGEVLSSVVDDLGVGDGG